MKFSVTPYAVSAPAVLGSKPNYLSGVAPFASGSMAVAELPGLSSRSLGGTAAAARVPRNTQFLRSVDLVQLMQVPFSSYQGASVDMLNRLRSQFRGQVVLPNLQGPVAKVLSFLPAGAFQSKNTDPALLKAIDGSTGALQLNGKVNQYVLGYVLGFDTLASGASAYQSKPGATYSGSDALGTSLIVPIYAPL